MDITTIGAKFVHDLSEIYDAELRFLEAQREMEMKATAPELKAMLVEHQVQTRHQIENIERIFTALDNNPVRNDDMAAKGLVQAGQIAMLAAADNPWYRDCVIASAVAKVEHYEIACYRNLVATSERVKRPDLHSLLSQNLLEEEQTAHKIENSYLVLLDAALATQKLDSGTGLVQPVLS